MSTQLDTVVENVTQHGAPTHAHIVDRGDDPRPATSLVLEAMVNGTPLTSLCGYVWVPSRNPLDLPVCPKCLEIVEFAQDIRPGHIGV
jgi:Protein of unknown function (DUF3039)